MALRYSRAQDGATVLLVGNSLLAHGLDYAMIRAELAPDARVIRYAIEQTSYLDWYYGLRRLFAEGVRPSRVALFLNLGATVNSEILGDYSARYLFQARDLIAVAHDVHFDTTQTSSLIFSHWSAFYGSRATIRNYILNTADPDYADAIHQIAIQPAPMPTETEAIKIARPRLRALKQLCMQNHSDFTFVVPPAISRRDEILLRAAVLENVDAVAPVELGSLGTEFYEDRFHLNPKGAKLFTTALAREIRTRLPVRR